MTFININDYEYSNFSQNGEDGIINFLCNKLKNNEKHFVEIGCGNGLENNSTNLVLDEWSGIVVDVQNNIKQYKKLLKIIQPKQDIKYAAGNINLKNILDLIKIIKEKKITFLSLDIDSYDFYIMMEILKYKILPKIICVEYNSFLGKKPLTIKYIENFQRYLFDKARGLYFGASLEAWKMLFSKYDYTFVCVDNNGVNAFFILHEFFNDNFFEFKGLQFQYTKFFVNKYKLDGKILENDLINNFKNEFVNINKLI